MKSKVYFIRINDSDNMDIIKVKLSYLLDESKLMDFICPDDKVAVKLHFGEEANTGFVRPEYVRKVIDRIINRRAAATLVDTNTLYRGRRTDTEEHIKIALEHGFTQEVAGAKIEIIEGSRDVKLNGEFIKAAKIGAGFSKFNVMVGIAHFKGHMMTGFGGALKNIGMGCASPEGKLAQHSDIAPFVRIDACIGCEACLAVCPVHAISIINGKAHIDNEKCIGCASCMVSCLQEAIDVAWEKGGINIQEKMVEYAKAILEDKQKKFIFINFAVKITKECDCLAKDDPKISPDIGILASLDPVSIDKAVLDLVIETCGKDIFKEVHPDRDGFKQLEHGFKIGIGNLEYDLIKIKSG